MKKRSIKYALIATLWLRLVPSIILAISSVVMPIARCPNFPCSGDTYSNLINSGSFSKILLAPWYRWDTIHYVEIAQNGYSLAELDNTTWPPLYPFLVGILARIMPSMLAALLVSTVAIFFALYLLHQTVFEIWGEAIANKVLLILIIFPTSFYFVSGYTESLFFALTIASIINARRRNWLLAGVFGGLATLTRHQGVLLMIPFIWEGYELYRTRTSLHWPTYLKILFSSSLIPFAFILNSIYIHYVVKAPWPWTARSEIWQIHLDWPWVGIIGNISFLFHRMDWFLVTSVIVDLLMIILFVYLLLRKVPLMPVSYILYGLIMLIPSLTMVSGWNTMTGVSRFVLPLFPAFISLTLLLNTKVKETIWVIFSFISQIVLLVLFYSWIWVA